MIKRAASLFSVSILLLNPISRAEVLTPFNIDIPVTKRIPVLRNKRGATQEYIKPRANQNVVANIIEERRGMYLMHITRDGVRDQGKYLISKKWANIILNIDAVVKAGQMNSIAQTSTRAPTENRNCPAPEVPVQVVPQPRPQTRELAPELSSVPVPRPRPARTVTTPEPTQQTRESYNSRGLCENFDQYVRTFRRHGANVDALKQAFRYYQLNPNKFPNKKITVADYSLRSNKPRFFKIDLRTKTITPPVDVSHGSGSKNGVKHGDPNHDGHLDACHRPGTSRSNLANRTNMTRPGFFKTKHPYMSTVCSKGGKKATCARRGGTLVPRPNWPRFSLNVKRNGQTVSRQFNGMRMEGLSRGINSNADNVGVVMHEADYNRGAIMGRSYGCPAFRPGEGRSIMDEIRDGSLFYSYVPKCGADMRDVLKDVPGWQTTCVR